MPAPTAAEKRQRRDNARDHLTSPEGIALQAGDTVYTNARNDAGTMLKLYTIKSHHTTGEPIILDITWYAAHATEQAPYDRRGSEWVIRNNSGGMDRGAAEVMMLSRHLFGDDYALTHRWL